MPERRAGQVVLVVPAGRSAAERRLGAIAALHQPVWDTASTEARVYGPRHVCSACRTNNWPCATAKLLGPWPGEPGVDDSR